MQNFAHSGSEAFSLRLDWIREYFLGYRELMDHWREVVPGSIVDVEYEQLVNAPEEATRAMLMACDLEWNEDCLEFASTQRRVGTASAWQVRQPLYTSSLDRWRNYQQHLEPLKELLAYAPSR